MKSLPKMAGVSTLLMLWAGVSFCAETTLTVQGLPTWQDSGIDVRAGDYLRIAASGRIYYNRNDSRAYTDPNGAGPLLQDRPAPVGPPDGFLGPPTIAFSLVGKIGGGKELATGTPLPEGKPGKGPGFMGTDYDRRIPVSGRLFLAYNDHVRYWDNSGSFQLRVEVEEAPAAACTSPVACRCRPCRRAECPPRRWARWRACRCR